MHYNVAFRDHYNGQNKYYKNVRIADDGDLLVIKDENGSTIVEKPYYGQYRYAEVDDNGNIIGNWEEMTLYKKYRY